MNLKRLFLLTPIVLGPLGNAAPAPEPIQEIIDYFQQPKPLHVGVVVTNYRPTHLIRHKQDLRGIANRLTRNAPIAKELTYFEFAASDQQLVYKELFVDPSITKFPLTSSISSNPHSLFLGRSSNAWWYATPFPRGPGKTVMAINALVDSEDGLQSTPEHQNNPFYRTLIHNEGAVFHHLKLGPFLPNTFQIHPTRNARHYTWNATNFDGRLRGTFKVTPGGEIALTRVDRAGKVAVSVRLLWDQENKLPAQFFILNPSDPNEIYQSYTRLSAPVGLWQSPPNGFHYSDHANSQDLITRHGINGKVSAENYVQTPEAHRERPRSKSHLILPLVFAVFLSAILFASRSLHKRPDGCD